MVVYSEHDMPKKNFFKTLPGDGSAHRNIAEHLSTQEVAHLSLTSQDERELVAPALRQRKIAVFLSHVARGEQADARALLQADPFLMFQRGPVTDFSGRTFPSVSGFEYALWAMDTRMWRMMLECIPDSPEGENLKALLLTQSQLLETEGLSYNRAGHHFDHQHHFDFTPLRLAMQTYVDPAMRDHFYHVIGQEQYLVPAHVAQEYCCRSYQTSFHYLTEADFEGDLFERSLVIRGFGGEAEDTTWWPVVDTSLLRLGRDFAVAWEGGPRYFLSGINEYPPGPARVAAEKDVLDRLFLVRTRELGLIEDLLSPGHEEQPHP